MGRTHATAEGRRPRQRGPGLVRQLPSRHLIAVSLAAVVSLSRPVATGGEEPPQPLPAVAVLLGPEGEDLGGERFAAAVTKAGLPAKVATDLAPSWRQPAAAASPWLAGVTTGFGERADAYAFWFDPAGSLHRFAHVPYGKTALPGGTRVWRAPVDRLAAAIVLAMGQPPLAGPPISIRIRCEQSAGEAGPVADPEVFEAIAWAAACRAGWTPAAAAAATRATLGVAAGVTSFSFRLSLESAGGDRELRKRSVPEDHVHDVLRRMFACSRPGSLATDFLQPEEADTVTAEPASAGRLVIAGTGGDLFALDGDGGGVAGQRRLAPDLLGRLPVIGELAVGFARETNTLVAVAAASGQPAWSQPLGDVPVKPPVATPAGLLVATKSNRLFLLDPETGRPRAERRLPGWIGDVIVLPGGPADTAGRIVCLTRDGTLTLLDAAALEPVGERRLAVRPGYAGPARVVVAPQFPVAWPGPQPTTGQADELEGELDAGLADRADCLLVADEDGYTWIIPTARLPEAGR